MIVRHVETLFCDDIRHEMGGKTSFIGVYSGGLFVPAFPITLPKLCLSVKIVTPVDEPLCSLNLRILKNEDLLQEIALDEEQLSAASDSPEDTTDIQRKERVQIAQFILVFSPIQFDEACTLRVRVQTGECELKGVGLKVAQTPPRPADSVPELPVS